MKPFLSYFSSFEAVVTYLVQVIADKSRACLQVPFYNIFIYRDLVIIECFHVQGRCYI